MAHEIDLSNRRANIAYSGEAPWHGLGFNLSDAADLDTWRKAAGLNWSVEETPALYRDPARAGYVHTARDHKVLLRSDTRAPLSIMSEGYIVVQPVEVLGFFEDLIKGNGFTMETAGSLRGGRRIWALVRVGEDATVIDGDKVRPYLLLATSYDGSMATTAQFTSIRVVCNNTLTAAVGDRDEPRVRISHMAKFDATTVRQQLSIAVSSWEKFLMKAKQLAQAPG